MVGDLNAVYIGIDLEYGDVRLTKGKWYSTELKCPLSSVGCYSVRIFYEDGKHVDIRYGDANALLKEWWFKKHRKKEEKEI